MEIATNWSVVDSGEPAAVLDTRPTDFILKMPVDAGAIRAATLAENIPARPGDEFQISFDYITEGTTREADLQFYFQFRDVNDGLLGPIFYTVQDANNTSWQRGSDVVTAPAGTAKLNVISLRRLPGGSGSASSLVAPNVAAENLLRVIKNISSGQSDACIAWDGARIVP